ncbi:MULTISPECIES: DUF2268 domain-containing putative Zn-dependent protease [unclassified Pseudoxanthomonas]|uniref:DUF2268 domain-containing putative Zn-dependent protease n=1 Tax=unclassified Pseudoxanthomonas TaxID=2645906 RepID=UPI00160F0DB2|nr:MULTISPECIES: DUF2268 domain-containing putative Zn-dependent protease [unclassified Pseudoxanthomonas]MBB3275766.1 hypothetical protein [Pseudoxanthomonas sp. OG2]MBV7473149.1 DUF2268 domain-containing protein [Pseudoxanthomonas sp. PXM05]
MRLALMAVMVCAVLGATTSQGWAADAKAGDPVVDIDDVERFYRLYDSVQGHPSAEQLQRDYLDAGSEGLHHFAKARRITGEAIAANLAKNPQAYIDAKRCMEVLPDTRNRLRASLRKLVELYPEARLPTVTIAVGRGKPVGTASADTGVQIGLEALCATDWLNPDLEDRFVHVIAHEYVHVQQVPAFVETEQATVLESALMEGAAEFVGELISGEVAYLHLKQNTKGQELAIETKFQADMDKRDLSDWIYNSKPGNPGDLGYWVGYRIVKSYYQNASDKRQALRDIIGLQDARAFLARSGWQPGIELR